MTETNTLPAVVIVQEDKQRIAMELRKDIGRLQNSFRQLRALVAREGLGAVPPLTDISKDWVDTLITGRQEAVRRSPLPSEAKQSTNAQWGKIGHAMKAAAATIDEVLSKFPDVAFVFDDKIMNYSTARTIEEIATEAATKEVPKEAQDHWRLICSVADAIKHLRDWEDERDVQRLPLAALVRFSTANDIAQKWAQGVIKYNYDLMDDYTKSMITINKEREL